VAFENMVAAVQIGTVIARDAKALARWQSRVGGARGLTGASLAKAVDFIAVKTRNSRYPGRPDMPANVRTVRASELVN